MVLAISSENLGPSFYLRRGKEEILKDWAARVRNECLDAKEKNHILYNSVPSFLDRIVEALDPSTSSSSACDVDASVCKEHGQQRATATDYTLKEVILEYGILQEIIFEVLQKETPLSQKDSAIIRKSIHQGIAESASEYAHIQDSIKEQFIALLTHDLRNPLTSTSANAQILLSRLDSTDQRGLLVRKIIRGTQRMDNLLQDLLDVFQIRAGRSLPFQFELCDLSTIAKDAVEDLTAIYGARFTLKSPPQLKGRWSPSGLRRVIENLANNAAKYGNVETPITISLFRYKHEAEISVHNYGDPIPASAQDSLFQPFYRFQFSKVLQNKGWGLGLTLVQEVTRAHHGRISLESTREKGTTFTIRLPLNLKQPQDVG